MILRVTEYGSIVDVLSEVNRNFTNAVSCSTTLEHASNLRSMGDACPAPSVIS